MVALLNDRNRKTTFTEILAHKKNIYLLMCFELIKALLALKACYIPFFNENFALVSEYIHLYISIINQ